MSLIDKEMCLSWFYKCLVGSTSNILAGNLSRALSETFHRWHLSCVTWGRINLYRLACFEWCQPENKAVHRLPLTRLSTLKLYWLICVKMQIWLWNFFTTKSNHFTLSTCHPRPHREASHSGRGARDEGEKCFLRFGLAEPACQGCKGSLSPHSCSAPSIASLHHSTIFKPRLFSCIYVGTCAGV